MTTEFQDSRARAEYVRKSIPEGGLFDGHEWRVSLAPFALEPKLVRELEGFGRIFLQFYRALNLLYRQSVAGQQPKWVAEWLDQGKPAELVELQRSQSFKNDLPKVIRPDVLLTEDGFAISELDSVPGGIGLTAWLNKTYSEIGDEVIGGRFGMLEGFEGIFKEDTQVRIVVSDEAASYRPEMRWLSSQLNLKSNRFMVTDESETTFSSGVSVYRFFELFDVPDIPSAKKIFDLASKNEIGLTPPPKAVFEEKLMFALLWNKNLEEFWRQNLGAKFFQRLKAVVPYTWVIDPSPLPPQAAIPGLELTSWHQLKTLSQRERDLILKVSGFSENAWGARGVYLGSDLSAEDWTDAVDIAIRSFGQSPFILQRYHKPKSVDATWFDFDENQERAMRGRVRLCPYYFVQGNGDNARAGLGGILATICPEDKKIIHGMRDAVLAPCKLQT